MDNTQNQQTTPTTPSSSYGKRPLWQWILIYVVIAIIVYGLIYYIFWGRNHGYSYNTTSNKAATTTVQQTTSSDVPSSNIYQVKTGTKGSYLTDFQGMSLYTYSQDTSGVSNCTGSCASTWTPYTSGAVAEGIFPTNISVITRSDGSKQFAYKNKPLYYYSGDTQAGQTNGDGIGGFNLATK